MEAGRCAVERTALLCSLSPRVRSAAGIVADTVSATMPAADRTLGEREQVSATMPAADRTLGEREQTSYAVNVGAHITSECPCVPVKL